MIRRRVIGFVLLLCAGTPTACVDFECDIREANCEPLVWLAYLCIPSVIGGNAQGCPLELSGTVTTIAGQAGVTGTADGIGTAATFDFPNGVTTDGSFIYIADAQGANIRRLDHKTREVTPLVTGLMLPRDVLYESGALYIADASAHKIKRYDLTSGVLADFAGDGTNAFLDGFGTAAQLNFPQGVTSDGSFLYVIDSGNTVIRKINLATTEVTRLSGMVAGGGFADGVSSVAQFSGPAGGTVVGTKLYVADGSNDAIREVDTTTGTVRTIAGQGGVPGLADGIQTDARFDFPFGMSTDGFFLYVTEVGNHTIRKVDLATLEVTTISGTGATGTADGVGTAATHAQPRGIANNGTSLFVGDTTDGRTVRLIQ